MLLNANDGQEVPNLKFVIESDLDVVNAISLELYAAKDVDIRRIRIQGGQSESQFALAMVCSSSHARISDFSVKSPVPPHHRVQRQNLKNPMGTVCAGIIPKTPTSVC